MQQQGTLYQKEQPYQLPILPMPALLFSTELEQRMASGANPKKPRGIRLTARDAEILEALHGVEYLTTHQICALFFSESQGAIGPTKACERRMRLLHAAGLVRRIEQPVKRGEGSKPFIYALSKKGAEFLITETGIDPADIDWRPQSFEANTPFLNHLLTTTDLRIALMKASKQAGVEVVEWIDERELRIAKMFDYVMLTGRTGQEARTAVIPDAVFVLERDGKRALFFVEIDLRTVTVEPKLFERKGMAKKFRTYEIYFNTPEFLARYEGRRARVLTVTTGEKRVNNLKQVTERVASESKGLFWFSTFDRALDPAQLLASPIWTVAGDDTLHTLL